MRPTETQKDPRRPEETQRDQKRPKKTQGDPEAQGDPKRSK